MGPVPRGVDSEARMAEEAPGGESDNPRARIARGIVALLKEHAGRGPESAKAYLWEDVVLVVMFGGYSPLERTLYEAGSGRAVVEQRARFQDAMRERFSELIEAETGRKVVAFMSGDDPTADASSELFLLEPLTSD
jgi:uncharacterized protein YbcI